MLAGSAASFGFVVGAAELTTFSGTNAVEWAAVTVKLITLVTAAPKVGAVIVPARLAAALPAVDVRWRPLATVPAAAPLVLDFAAQSLWHSFVSPGLYPP